MAHGEPEVIHSTARSRGTRDRTYSGVLRGIDTLQTNPNEEINPQSTLGEGERNTLTSNVILPEDGELPGDTMVAMREWYRNLRREFSRIINRATEVEFLTEEWWELIDEAETIQHTAETILGFIRRT